MSRDRNPDYSLTDAIVETEPFITALLGEQPKLKRFKQVYMGYRIARPIYTLLTKKPVKISTDTTYTYKLEYGSHMYKLLSDWMRENLEARQLNTFEVDDSWQWVRRPQEGDTDFTIMSTEERTEAAKALKDSIYDDDEDAEDRPMPTAVQARIPMFLFKAEHPKRFKYAGEWITLDPTGGEEANKTTNSEGQEIVGPQWHNDIALIAHGEDAKAAVEQLMTDLLMNSQHFGSGVRPNVPNDVFMMKRSNSEWRWRAHVPPRNFKNVFLNDGLAETLCADIKDFMEMRGPFERLGMPYHRGYLLYGPPGTGKTSVVQAIANKFNLNLYVLALGDVRNDSELAELFANVTGNKSIILIEDVDVVHMSMNRNGDDKVKEGISLSGFLNVIDGVTSASGTILMMTTNDKKIPDPDDPSKMIFERLDKALVRPGRVDFELEIGYMDETQYQGFFNLFYEQDPITPFAELDFFETAPAEVLECFKRYPLDIVKANEFLVKQFGRNSDPSEREELHARHGSAALLGKTVIDGQNGDSDDLDDLVKILLKPGKAKKAKAAKKGKKTKKAKKA